MPLNLFIIWHGEKGKIDHKNFISVQEISFKSERYIKGKMCNIGVEKCGFEKIALIDSDRIMPPNYYTTTFNNLNDKCAISPLKSIKLLEYTTLENIYNKKFSYKRDDRTKEINHYTKHLFSGNTVFFRKDYLSIGGMDESFIGYGYNDLDFSLSWQKSGMQTIWSDQEEIHLFHDCLFLTDKNIFYDINKMNALKFCKKWNIELPNNINIKDLSYYCLM